MVPLIYKIVSRTAWRAAEETGSFAGAAVDVSDGFIHFSDAGQLRETAAKHFAGMDDLVLVAVEADRLGAALKWEVSRGGALFPHLFGPLALSQVAWVEELPLDAAGMHRFPERVAC